MMNKRNILIIIISVLLVITLGIAYGYFAPSIGTGANTNINVTSKTTDKLSFIKGTDISFVATQQNFTNGGTNLSATTTSSAKLVANSNTNSATDTYNVYLVVSYNDFVYTSGTTPELILTITDPTGNSVTSLTGYSYVTSGEVSGFDITTKKGLMQIASDYQISTTSSTIGTTQNWTITLTFINLATDQYDNSGKTFKGNLLLQRDDITDSEITLAKLNINKTSVDLIEPNFQIPSDDNYYCVVTDYDTTQKVFDTDNGYLTSTTGTENTCAVNIYRYDGTNALNGEGTIMYLNQATYTDTDSNTTYTGTLVGTGSWQKEATGIYSKADDYGTSYYYRGAIDNNWLKFGKYETDWYTGWDSNSNGMQGTSCTGITTDCTKVASAGDDMYWRIVRVNGDGSLKLIYAGVTAPTSATSIVNDNNTLGPSRYNTSYNSAEYVGYMYTLGELHGTGTSSTIKTYLENWYSNNLSNYDSKIADTIYCNDRTVYQLNTTLWGDGTSGTGMGTNITYFGAFNRFAPSGGYAGTINGTPILTCPTKADAFTKNDTIKGNGKLSQKIGLLTADEANLGGLGVFTWLQNYSNYLATNTNYWLESPFAFYGNVASVFSVYGGYIGSRGVDYSDVRVRPSVSLSSDIQITGSGTWDDPYIAK